MAATSSHCGASGSTRVTGKKPASTTGPGWRSCGQGLPSAKSRPRQGWPKRKPRPCPARPGAAVGPGAVDAQVGRVGADVHVPCASRAEGADTAACVAVPPGVLQLLRLAGEVGCSPPGRAGACAAGESCVRWVFQAARLLLGVVEHVVQRRRRKCALVAHTLRPRPAPAAAANRPQQKRAAPRRCVWTRPRVRGKATGHRAVQSVRRWGQSSVCAQQPAGGHRV